MVTYHDEDGEAEHDDHELRGQRGDDEDIQVEDSEQGHENRLVHFVHLSGSRIVGALSGVETRNNTCVHYEERCHMALGGKCGQPA